MKPKKINTPGSKSIYIRENMYQREGYNVFYPHMVFGGRWLADLGFKKDNRAELLYAPGVVVVATQPIPKTVREKIMETLALIGGQTPPENPAPPAIDLHPLPKPWPRLRPITPVDFGCVHLRSA
jgi:hypothetical protein